MKTRTHRHKVAFPIFSKFTVNVVFTSDFPKEFERQREPYPGDATAYTITSPDGHAHILLPHDADAETIAHETFHAIWSLMKFAGAELEEEVVAYHLGHVVGLITKWGKRHVQ